MPTIEELLLGKPLKPRIEPEAVVEEEVPETPEETPDAVLSVEESATLLGLKALPSNEEAVEEQVAQDEVSYVAGVDWGKGDDSIAIVKVAVEAGDVGPLTPEMLACSPEEEDQITCQIALDGGYTQEEVSGSGYRDILVTDDLPDVVEALRKAVQSGEVAPEKAIEELKKLDKDHTLPFSVAAEFVGYKEASAASRPLDDDLLQQAAEELEKNEKALRILQGGLASRGIQEMVRLVEVKKEPEPQVVTIAGTPKVEEASCDYEELDLNDLGASVSEVWVFGEPKNIGKLTREKWEQSREDLHRDPQAWLGVKDPPVKAAEKPHAPPDTVDTLVEGVGFVEPYMAPGDPSGVIVEDIGFDEDLPSESKAPKVAYETVESLKLPNSRVVLIDGSNMAMRCYFSLKDMCRSDGRPTGLLYGMLKSIRSVQRDCKAVPLLVWDGGGTRKKREIYAGYKGNRGESDIKSACFGELENVKEWIRYLGVPQSVQQGEEADDVIGALAYGAFKDAFVFVYSSDDDFLQLVDDAHCVAVKPGKEGPVFYDSEKVEERLGVSPELVPMFRCLRGDKSDNLPGIPNFQSKKIVELVKAYPSIEELWSNPEENFKALTPKSRDKIGIFREQAEVNLKLMTLDRGLQPDIQVSPFSGPSLRALFEEMEFNSYLEAFEDWEADFRGSTGFMKTGRRDV